MEAERDLKMLNAGFEDAERSHKLRNTALKPGTDKEMVCPLESPEGAQFCWHLDFDPVILILQLCRRINLCCFK